MGSSNKRENQSMYFEMFLELRNRPETAHVQHIKRSHVLGTRKRGRTVKP